MNDSQLSAIDRQRLFDLIDACHCGVGCSETEVMAKLRGLLAYQLFAHGTADFGPQRRVQCLGGKLPPGLLDDTASSRRGVFHCLLKEWLAAHEPVYAEVPALPSHGDRFDNGCSTQQVLAVHGIADASRCSASWYAFVKHGFSQRDHAILRMAVPHLHAVLAARASSVKLTAGVEPLTPRETEVLQWLAKGKANAEISMVLGISVCTVRVHIQNIFNKLPANNRTHAAARALQLGLIDPVPVRESRGFAMLRPSEA